MFRLAFLLTLLAGPALACGPDTDCRLGERTYRIGKPTGATGAFVFLHGWRGTADGIMRNRAMRRLVADQGFALVAPQSQGAQWSLPAMPSGQRFDERPFWQALVDDLVANHGIDRSRIVIAGFSAGGMAAWDLACRMPDLAAGYVPISGTYWGGPPEPCAAPAPNIVHIHGSRDRTVPFGGRPLGDTRQGDVAASLADMRERFGYEAETTFEDGRLTCEVERNGAGRLLEVCMHGGGHDMPAEFAAFGLRQLRERTPLE